MAPLANIMPVFQDRGIAPAPVFSDRCAHGALCIAHATGALVTVVRGIVYA